LQGLDSGFSNHLGAGNHYEMGARVTGTIRFDGQDYAIDTLGFRDHSWSPRWWSGPKVMPMHRWISCAIREDLVFNATIGYHSDGQTMMFGFLWDGSKFSKIVDMDVAMILESDAFTCRGGRVSADYHNGTRLEFDLEARSGVLMAVQGHLVVEAPGVATFADGSSGHCHIEYCNNARQGRDHLAYASPTVPLTQGYSHCAPLPTLRLVGE
jgi:hypothetical protein